ncbi:MAG: AAA family ATPase, partial [Oscillochloris sp.]|nr:AAA family ATPase [Oscillochloris sp.]
MTVAQTGLPTTQRDSERPQRFWLLGGMRAIGPAGPISLPGGRVRSLLAYLLLHPRVPHPREVLAELLWPDSSPGVARRSLTSLLYILRRAIGHQIISATPETLSLYPDSVVWVDVWEFERLVALPDTTALQQATGLYSGDLLPELYDDWLAVPRASLREHYLAALLRLANAETERSPANAVEYYRTLLAYDPLREEAGRGLMHCLARLGRRHEALAVYTDLAATLEAELGAYPERITRELANSIGREESHLAHAPRQAEPAFVGRTAERATLIARLEQARSGRGGLASVLGEAGIGKTRLLGELARAAGWRGWQVIWARAPQAAAPAPYAP